jgi:hypothetical protein
LLSLELEKAPITYTEPLINYEFPYFSNLFEAIKDWAELLKFHDYNDGRVGGVFVILPDNRFYFESIELDKNILKLSTKTGYPRRLSSIIRGAYTYKNMKETFEAKPSHGKMKIYIGNQKPEQIEFWLIGKKNQIYDFYIENKFWSKNQLRILKDSLNEENDIKNIEEAINKGEGPNIEFKPFIKLKNDKMDEVIKTIIAFANTSGGHLYIGIDDSCNIVGIEKEIRKSLGKDRPDIEKVYDIYEGTLKQIINDCLNTSLNFKLKRVIFVKTVIVIKVPEGNQKPYYNIKTKEIFIRRGANNVRPNPDYEIRPLYEKHSESLLLS